MYNSYRGNHLDGQILLRECEEMKEKEGYAFVTSIGP